MRARGRGRPSEDGGRYNRLNVRLSDEEIKMIDYIAEKSDETKSEMIRNAIRMRYRLEKMKE